MPGSISRFPTHRQTAAAGAFFALAVVAAACGDGSSGGSPRAGELFTVESTTSIGTLLGYGEVDLQSSFPPYNQSAASGGDVLWGTDLGLPVTVTTAAPGGGSQTLTLYLFGDTDQLDLQVLSQTGFVQKHVPRPGETFVGPSGPFEGDAIGVSMDSDPSDGIELDLVYRNQETGETTPVCDLASPNGFRPVHLAGIHADPCVQVLPNTTPTGAWAVGETIFMLASVQDPNDLAQARSYLTASTDLGLSWTVLDNGQPFSANGPSARFIHAAAVAVDAADHQDATRSGPCKLPLPTGSNTRGLLLFGTGLWKASDVYLAFVAESDLLAAAGDPTRAVSPWYFAGTDYRAPGGGVCWSTTESDAQPIIEVSDKSAYSRFEDACGTTIDGSGAGYTSTIRVQQTLTNGTVIDRLVMLLSPAYQGTSSSAQFVDADLGTTLVTGDPLRPWVWNLAIDPASHDGRLPAQRRFRPLAVPPDPTSGLQPNTPACTSSPLSWQTVAGYAPLFIDRYTRLSADGLGVDLFFNVSRWNVPTGPGDTGPTTVDAYHYVVETLRTTLRPTTGGG